MEITGLSRSFLDYFYNLLSMKKVFFQYLGNEHTYIRPSENEPKKKVSNGEIIEVDADFYGKGRLIIAGFREVVKVGKEYRALEAGNDVVVRENAEKAEAEKLAKEKAEKNSADNTKPEGGVVSDGLAAPKIDLPGSTDTPITTEVKDDGKTDITIEVKNLDYSTMKQPELKAEMESRGLAVPEGLVKNEILIEALVADDAKKKAEAEGANAPA